MSRTGGGGLKDLVRLEPLISCHLAGEGRVCLDPIDNQGSVNDGASKDLFFRGCLMAWLMSQLTFVDVDLRLQGG